MQHPSRSRLVGVLAFVGLMAGVSLASTSSAIPSPPAPLARPLPCTPADEIIQGNWQAFTVGAFPVVAGAPGAGKITSYAVDPLDPRRVLISDGVSVRFSDTSGCGFRTVLTLPASPDPSLLVSGATAHIVSITFLKHEALLLVVDGSGAAARAHVIQSPTAESGTWTLTDNGLPPTGAPGELHVANDGHTVYLSVTPPAAVGIAVRPLLGADAPVLYRSIDSGTSWSAATSLSTVASVHPLSTFAVDPEAASSLWGVVDGQLTRSSDSGATFSLVAGIDTSTAGYNFVALSAFAPKSVVGYSSDSGDSGPVVLVTHDNGASFRQQISPGQVVNAAPRGLHPISELVALNSPAGPKLVEYFIEGGRIRDITPRFTKTATDAAGDVAYDGATYHAHSDTQVLRYLDTLERSQTLVDDPTFANGLLAAPHPGRMLPAVRVIHARTGASATSTYALHLPPNPSPLDVFLAIDTSRSMHDVIGNLQAGFESVADNLRHRGVNIEVGVGAIGTSPCQGSAPDPPTDPTVKGYKRPSPFTRLRAIGPLDQSLSNALASLAIETQSTTNGCDRPEGQLVALDQLANGSGVRDPALLGSAVYIVAPGQVAGWRQGTASRRVIVVVTDGGFGKALGAPTLPSGALDFGYVANELRDQRAQVIGLSSSDPDATRDESIMARGTGGITPPSGIDCFDADTPKLAPGTPAVCGTHQSISEAVLSALGALSGSASIGVRITDPGNVVASVDHAALDSVKLFDPTTTPLAVTVRCSDPGTFPVSLATTLRGVSVGSTSLTVVCTGAPKPLLAALPPLPLAPLPPQIAAAPAAPVPPAQPPGQLVNAQGQPAAAGQRQEEIQVAIADQDTTRDVNPEDIPLYSPDEAPLQSMSMSAHSSNSADAVYALAGMALISCLGAAGAVGIRVRARSAAAPALAPALPPAAHR